jgi:hypothetical protein
MQSFYIFRQLFYFILSGTLPWTFIKYCLIAIKIVKFWNVQLIYVSLTWENEHNATSNWDYLVHVSNGYSLNCWTCRHHTFWLISLVLLHKSCDTHSSSKCSNYGQFLMNRILVTLLKMNLYTNYIGKIKGILVQNNLIYVLFMVYF